jgi:hypothetical protein
VTERFEDGIEELCRSLVVYEKSSHFKFKNSRRKVKYDPRRNFILLKLKLLLKGLD